MSTINDIVVNLMCEKQNVESMRVNMLQILELIEQQQSQPQPKVKARDYGPKSQRKMTRRDAWEIVFGKYKTFKVNEICDLEGLSRGQVYSVRGGYTFRDIEHDEFEEESEE